MVVNHRSLLKCGLAVVYVTLEYMTMLRGMKGAEKSTRHNSRRTVRPFVYFSIEP